MPDIDRVLLIWFGQRIAAFRGREVPAGRFAGGWDLLKPTRQADLRTATITEDLGLTDAFPLQPFGQDTDQTVEAADCRRERGRVSLTSRWLPQLDLVSLWIDDPGKLAVLRVIEFVEDVAAFRFERRNHSVKIFNAIANLDLRERAA